MWVRSQDKLDLINCNAFYIEKTCSSNEWNVCERDRYEMVGKYSSKEKALKVMDMVQSFIEALAKVEITSNMIVRDNNNKIINNMIFQMPLDSEVSDDD